MALNAADVYGTFGQIKTGDTESMNGTPDSDAPKDTTSPPGGVKIKKPGGHSEKNESPEVNPPTTPWEFLFLFLTDKRFKRQVIVLIAVLVLLAPIGLAAYATLRYFGYDVQPSFPFLKRSIEAMQEGVLKKTIYEGIKQQKNYAMESVTYMVRITDITNTITSTNGPKTVTHRLVNSRVVYVLRALRDISANENTTFAEIYTSPFAKELDYWPGSDLEKGRTGGGTYVSPERYYTNQFVKYNVYFNVKRGDLHTVVTGSDEVFDLPLPDQRISRDVRLRQDEDIVVYPNDDDVIGELNIIVESDTTRLMPVQSLRFGVGAKSAPVEDGQIRMNESGDPADKSHPSTVVITGRWQSIPPGVRLGLLFRWNE